jgi:hypothetical protein
VRRTVEWKGTQQPYYQDEAQRRLLYYLPDAFKIARTSGPVRSPDMTVHVTSPDGSLEKTVGSLGYVAVPVTEAARLESARQRLKNVPDGGGESFLELLPASKLSFKLDCQNREARPYRSPSRRTLLTMTKAFGRACRGSPSCLRRDLQFVSLSSRGRQSDSANGFHSAIPSRPG